MLHSRKVRSEAVEKAQSKTDGEGAEGAVDSPSLHKDDLLDDEENDMSENESVGTQPEEVIIKKSQFTLWNFLSFNNLLVMNCCWNKSVCLVWFLFEHPLFLSLLFRRKTTNYLVKSWVRSSKNW